MISGFYAFSNNSEKLCKKLKRISLITTYSISIYFIFYSAYYLYNQTFTEFFYKLISLKNILKILLIQDLSSIGGFHLWFLPTLFLCYLFQIIIETIHKRKLCIATAPIATQSAPSVAFSDSSPTIRWGASETFNDSSEESDLNLVVILLVIFLVIHLIISIFKDSNYIPWNLKATFLGSGLFWFLLGNLIAEKKEYLLIKLHNKNLLVVISFLISGIIAVTPNYFEPNFSEFAIIIYSTSLFLLAIKNPTVHISKIFEFIGDKLSLNVYIWHIIIARILNVFINHLGFAQNSFYLEIRPIVVVISTLLISWLIYIINNWFSSDYKNL